MSKAVDMAATKRKSQAIRLKHIGGMLQHGSVGLAVFQAVKNNRLQGHEHVR